MAKKKTLRQQFDQLFEGNAKFIIGDKEGFTQTCCDCGSSHDINLEIKSMKWEIEVEVVKNLVVTRAARQDGCNGVLMSKPVFDDLMDMMTQFAMTGKVTKATAKRLLQKQRLFEDSIRVGVVL